MAAALETQFQDLTLDESSLKPGLFHLSLNLLYQPDSDTLNDRKKLLHMQLREEHTTTHLILQNLVALINHRLPRRQNEVRKILENVIKEHPKHLNTLANLEVVYRELHRHTDADRCRIEKEKILCNHDLEDIELKTQCILEQAYSLIVEETSNHEGVANQKLRDSLKILSNEHGKSSGERKEYLGKALRLAEQASSCVLNSMYCDRPDEKLERKKHGIEKFVQGLKMLESIGKNKSIEYRIWRFGLGMAYNRYDYSIYQQEEHSEKDTTRKDLTAKVLQIFWDTICDLKVTHKTRVYIARSYAYIGHLLISRKEIVNEALKSTAFRIRERSALMNLIKNPLSCFDQALKYRGRDTHVLNRYGRSLRNMSNSYSSPDQKWNILLDAHHFLSESIKILPHSNWFAYVTRMQTSRDLALLAEGDNKISWLEEARLDGINCFNSKATESDLTILARICQMLAKCPDIKMYGPQFVKNKEYIHEAIQYLNYALQLGGFVNFNVVCALSACLYEIEEYRTAIEWMKRAMHLSRKSGSCESLTRIGQYILTLYNAKLAEGDPNRNHLFDEMRFWIGQGKSKYSSIEPSISYICKHYANGMLEFINYLINSNQFNAESNRSLIKSCLDALQQWHESKPGYQQNINDLRAKLENLLSPVPEAETDLERSATYTPPDILMPFSLDATIQQSSYKYDFFVSHSNANRDWVNNYLLHQLETKLHDNDIAFKGCIADRDFTPGSTIISNIRSAVEDSYRVIFIITEDFVKSRWCDFEVDQALVEMLSTKKEDCIIPILLQDLTDQKFPQKLGHITNLDLTDESRHFQEVMKLKRTLSIDN